MSQFLMTSEKRIINLDTIIQIEKAEGKTTTVIIHTTTEEKVFLFGDEAKKFWETICNMPDNTHFVGRIIP